MEFAWLASTHSLPMAPGERPTKLQASRMVAEEPRPVLGSLEIGRFIAACSIMLLHVLDNMPSFTLHPGTVIFDGARPPRIFGVLYFFVLSGFVMMVSHHADFGKLASVPKFWWRRACRIYPMYWLAFAIMFFYLHGALQLTLPYLLQLVSLAPKTTADLPYPAWSLRFEIAFYITFGLCLLPYIGRLLLVFWIATTFWIYRPPSLSGLFWCGPAKTLFLLCYHYGSHFVAPFEFYFFAGLAGGWVFTFLPQLRQAGVSLSLILAGTLCLLVMGPCFEWGYIYPANPMADPVIGLAIAAVIVGFANLEREGVIRFGANARRLGAMSYPIYILHLPLIFAAEHFGLRLGTAGLYIFFAVSVPLYFTICAAAAFLLDQPLQRWLRGRRRQLNRPLATGFADVKEIRQRQEEIS